MSIIRTAVMATFIVMGALTLAAVPAAAAEKAKVQKCDKEGKVCTTGTDCKVKNCRHAKKKAKSKTE